MRWTSMRLITFSSLFIFSGSLLLGQQLDQRPAAAAHPLNRAEAMRAESGGKCPVGMHLTQGAGTQILRSRDRDSRALMTPMLTVTPADSRTIAAATISVFGFEPKGSEVVPLVAQKVPEGQKPSPLPSRKFNVDLHPDGRGNFNTTLSITDFT